jgi:MFS family permease
VPGTEPRPSIRLPGNLAPLGYRNYALYWIGLASSNAGRWIEQTGAVWLVYQLTDSPVLLGLLGVAKAMPTLLIAPFAGVVADRLNQRKLLFATQAIALVASLTLGILVLTNTVQLWHVYAEIAITSTISAFDIAARQALFPRLIPREHLPEGVTLTSLASRSSALIGPAAGGLAIASLGVASPFLINAATFLALMAALVAMRNVAPQIASARTSFVIELREGLSYIRRTNVLSGLLRLEVVFGVFQVNPVIIAIIAQEVLQVGPEGLGGLLSAPAVGALAGLGCLLIFGHSRRPGRFVVVLQWAYAVAMIGFAVSGQYVLSFVLLAATGFFDVLETVTRLSIAQLAAPGRMRGRVMANMRTVTGGIGPMAQTQSGIMAGAIGGPLAIVVAAFALAISAASVARLNLSLWRFTVDDVGDEPPISLDEDAPDPELDPEPAPLAPAPGPGTR